MNIMVLFSLGTRIETFLSCQILVIYLGETTTSWIFTSYFLIVISHKQGRTMPGVERGDKQESPYLKILLSPNNWFFSCGQVIQFLCAQEGGLTT